MFKELEVLRMAHAMARHAGVRQEVVARNVAHADTPGYRAKSVASFADTYRDRGDPTALRRSREGHFADLRSSASHARVTEDTRALSPNGNSVSLEREMLNAIAVKREHDRALAIYKSSLNVLRTSIGRR